MQVTEKKSDGLERAFSVVVSAQDIDERVDARLAELKGQIKLPGFRPGKIPAKLLKQRYGKSVMGEVLESTVQQTSQSLLEERNLRPALQPEIKVESFDAGKDLEYSISFEIIPDITPMDFSTLSLERPVVNVEDSEVDEALTRIAAGQKSTQKLKRKRKSRQGDVVTIDFDGSVDGENLPGMAGEDFALELGAGMFIPGFEDQMVGKNIDEDVTVHVTFPEDYGNEKLSGKDAVFAVKVKNIEDSVPAEINDALAEKMGLDNLDALKERVREKIRDEFGKAARSIMKRELLDKLAEAHDFDVPPGMVEQEFDSIWRQIESDKAAGRLDDDDKDKSDDDLRDEYRKIAIRRVRLGLLMSEVGTRNDIEVTQEDVNQALIREVQNYPGQEQHVFEYYQKNPQAMAALRAPVFEEKVVDFIVDLAQVSEKSLSQDELKAVMESEGGSDSNDQKPKSSKKKTSIKKTPAKKVTTKKEESES